MSKTRITREEIRDRARELKNERADIEDTNKNFDYNDSKCKDGYCNWSNGH